MLGSTLRDWRVGARYHQTDAAKALGCSPVAQAFVEGSDTIRPVKPSTIAKSLAIGNPADGYFALDVVRSTGGGLAAVTDDGRVRVMKSVLGAIAHPGEIAPLVRLGRRTSTARKVLDGLAGLGLARSFFL